MLGLLPLRAPADALELPTFSDHEVNTQRLGRESVEYLAELGYVTPCEPTPAK
ncbi:MAG: hypothetical protein Q3999_02355 [Buchananella hordeovulneris]|nr:hypothetical protein [Buchananella hordeovulneris]